MNKYFSCQNEIGLIDYLENLVNPEDESLKEIRSRSNNEGLPQIHLSGFDVRHLEVLVKANHVKKALEFGTLAGYSGVAIARNLAKDGKLYTFESHLKHAAVAKTSFEKNNLTDKVEILAGPALDNMNKIEHLGPFDFAFIDADKANYLNYFNWTKKHLKIGGLIVSDNVFAFGFIHKTNIEDNHNRKTAEHLQHFNQAVLNDKTFLSTFLPTGEGMLLSVKISD